jgi:hypothetical protein
VREIVFPRPILEIIVNLSMSVLKTLGKYGIYLNLAKL